MDLFGGTALTGFAMLLAFNQVVIKLTAGGIAPIAMAGLRSAGAFLVIGLWMLWRQDRPERVAVWSGVLAGGVFAFEFICLFVALDLTSVSRASIIFYSMPVHLALIAHFVLPGERLTRPRIAGLILAMTGVVIVMLDRDSGAQSVIGDLAALGAALSWAGIALIMRLTPLAHVREGTQLLWQLGVSAVILLPVAALVGPMFRAPGPVHALSMGFQIVAIASFGFLGWLWLIKRYPTSSVASFSFLSPVLSVILGWLLLGEEIGAEALIALALVAVGLLLINRRERPSGPR